MSDSLIGKDLDEYRLEKLLGQGGMARVYRGLDRGLRRYAAIKVIDTPHRQDEEYIARFEREARAIAQLDHPHIVTVYRYGRAENVLYLAMRYIEGADLLVILKDYEKDGELMPVAEVTRLVREIGAALDYSHKQGIIHRDVKPSNVMLNTDGQAYLTDFGLVLLTDVGTQGKILGSPHYISPEQAVSSARAVPQSDLYSLGVILFRMVTGQLPFEHDDTLELLMLHMTAETPDPRGFRPDVSPALAEVIMKAMAKEPGDRYPSGEALSEALETTVKDSSAAPVEVSTLSIMDRVALDMEILPQIPAAVTPQKDLRPSAQPPSKAAETAVPPEEQTIDVIQPRPAEVSQPASRPNWGLRLAGGCLVLVMLILGAVIFSGILRGVISAEDELTQGETAATVAAVPGNGADFTPTPASTALPVEPTPPGEIFMPLVTGEGGQQIVVVAPTPSPAADTPPTSPTVYHLLIVTNKRDSLFLVNQSTEAFPLALLRLENNDGAIVGTEWGVGQLQPGACVTIWKKSGDPESPDVECDRVGLEVTRERSERFWGKKFDIFYDGQPIGECDPKRECEIEIVK